MNYLAHLYLSGDNDEDLLVGNYITDGLKGRDRLNVSSKLIRGIQLHLKIDEFTDNHDVFKNSVARLRSDYRLYSGVIVDIFYDHFLALNWERFHDLPLQQYAQNIYGILDNRNNDLPLNSRRFLWYMKEFDILYNYSNIEGIKKVLDGMDKRSKMKSGMRKAINNLVNDYDYFEVEFNSFFPEIEEYVKALRI